MPSRLPTRNRAARPHGRHLRRGSFRPHPARPRCVYRPQVEGQHHRARSAGAVIFASNHLSFLDSIAIPIASPRPVHFLAKASYFDGKGFSGWLSREFFTAIGAVPVQRGAGQAALNALDQQRRLLERGQRRRPLSRGHALTRRPPLQGPHGRRLPRPRRPARRSSRSGSSAPTGSCRSARRCRRSRSASR